MATQTWTLDMAGLKYIDKDGIEHIINTNETMAFTFTDEGVGGKFIGLVGGGKVTCTDGFEFTIEADSRFEFKSSADGSATTENGEVCFVEDGNVRTVWKVVSITMTDADGTGANNIASITLEQVKNPMVRITWTNINTA